MSNLTPHSISVFNEAGEQFVFQPSGQVARVSTTAVTRPSHNGIPVIATVFGEVEGLGSPQDYPEGVLVSAMVLGRLGQEWSGVAFAPATGPKDGALRNEAGQIVAVTKLVTV